MLSGALRAALRRGGVELIAYRSRNFEHLRRRELLASGAIDVVLDVGANNGTWAREQREAGYAGRIVSFEPLADAFAELERRAAADPRWEARRVALGAADGEADLNVAANSGSSSLLPMAERHLANAPDSAYVRRETVPLARLDSLRADVLSDEERVFLKADVQGLELDVLRGAEETLAQVVAAELEVSFVPLYEGQPLAHELSAFLYERGFVVVAQETAWRDRHTGDLLHADALYLRR